MKLIKRAAVLLTLALWVMLMPLAAFAAGDTLNVWMDETAKTGSESNLSVSVTGDGKTTDGLLTLTYDPQALSVTAEDVQAGALAEMYSANVTQPGTLKISYIAAQGGEQGKLFDVKFTVLKQGADSGLFLYGDAFDGNEGALQVGVLSAGGEVVPSPSPSPSPTPSPSPSPSGSGSGAKTGDEAQPLLWLSLTALCGFGVFFCLRKQRGM